ncbi:MAG: DNA polymerase [Elusimicrobia bacterium]|nr:DNA polymerase [Elusimicrobiota bacterium]
MTDASALVRWLYLDMNSFFASVEQELNPALRGKPVAVVPLEADTTCCIAVSYEGKAFGVKTGTLVRDAKRLCTQMKFITGNHGDYVRFHHKIVDTVESCTPVEAVCSIDEMACRMTGSQQNVEKAQALARKIKTAIRDRVGASLKCSIGLGPNRYLAKIAADMKKPDGLTVLRPCDLPAALHAIALRDLPGVGAKTEQHLKQKGIFTVERLCRLSEREMHCAWGSICGSEMWHLLRGEELEQKYTEQKSISHSHILPPDLRTKAGAIRILKKLTDKAALRLRQEGFYASGLYIFARFLGKDGWRASCNLMETQDTLAFLNAVNKLWESVPGGQFFGVGVALTGLVPESLHTPSLFENQNRAKLAKTLDQLNAKFGKHAVHYGAIHESASLAPLRIAFTRIPNEQE